MPEMNIIQKAFKQGEGAEKLFEEFKHDAKGHSKATITAALIALLIETNKTPIVRAIGKVLAGSNNLYKLKGKQ